MHIITIYIIYLPKILGYLKSLNKLHLNNHPRKMKANPFEDLNVEAGYKKT